MTVSSASDSEHREAVPRRRGWRSWRRWAGIAAGLILLAGTVEILLHHYDPTRVLYKRFRAPDRYLYEEIHPRFLAIDPRQAIGIRDAEELARGRERLRALIWGRFGYPSDRLPAAAQPEGPASPRPKMAHVQNMEILTVAIGSELRTRSYLLHSKAPQGRLAIYHNGFASDVWSMTALLDGLAEQGFDVIAINLAGYGENPRTIPGPGGRRLSLHLDMAEMDTPLRYHFETPVVVLNYALSRKAYRSVDIIGFSAGAHFVATVAAVEPRIRRTVTVAGAYPLYLQAGQDIRPESPQAFPAMMAAVAELDVLVLAAAGRGRGVLQIFNQYDRCCFNNRKGELYEQAVADAVAGLGIGGAFSVWIDQSHADHKISAAGRARLLDFLKSPD